MFVETEHCKIKTCNNREIKNHIDKLAEQNFDLPTIKLNPGQRKEDFLPAIEKLVLSLTLAETSEDDSLFEIQIEEESAGYIRLVNVSTNCPEIGVALLPKFQGKGYAYEALSAFLEECDYPTIIWRANPNNVASSKLAKKLGATLDAMATESVGGIIETYILRK